MRAFVGNMLHSLGLGFLVTAGRKVRRLLRAPFSLTPHKIERFIQDNFSAKTYSHLKSFYVKHLKHRSRTRKRLSGQEAMIYLRDKELLFQGKRYSNYETFLAEHGKLKCICVICCAFHGRHSVLELVVEEGTCDPENSVLFCLVGSSDEDRAFLEDITARNPDVLGVITRNNPVGKKWQTAVQLGYAVCDFDLLGITGSDDVLCSALITNIIKRHQRNQENDKDNALSLALYGTMEWLVLADNANEQYYPQIVKCSYKHGTAFMPVGGGRFYTADFIKTIEGQLFDVKKNRLLDDFGYRLVEENGFGVELFDIRDGTMLSVKGDWKQMNDFDAIVLANTVKAEDFSFIGYQLLQKQMSEEVFAKIVSGNDVWEAH